VVPSHLSAGLPRMTGPRVPVFFSTHGVSTEERFNVFLGVV